MSIQKLTGYFLGLNLNGIPKPIKVKINEIIDTVNGITDGGSSFDTITEVTAGAGVTVDSVLLKDGTADFNGVADAVILDADGNTTISAPTNDQIDFEIGGADDFRMTANTFTALSGSTIATNTIAETTAANGVVIDGTTIKDGGVILASGSSLDTGVLAAGVTLAGTTLAADGTDANIDITITPKGTGAVVLPSGAVATPSIQIGTETDGFYRVGVNQLGVSVNNALATVFDASGIKVDSIRARVELGTATALANATAVSYGDGRNFTTIITLTATPFTIAAAANEAVGIKIFDFPAGAHLHEVTYMSIALQGGGVVNTDTPDVGIGSVIATGAVAVLGGTATFEDYITGQTAANCTGTPTVKTSVATAGALTGISINEAASVKAVHLNLADGWAGADTITATGTVALKWTILS